MKTTITVSVDVEIKRAVMPIIQNEMNTSLSAVINDCLKKIIEKKTKDKINKTNKNGNEILKTI